MLVFKEKKSLHTFLSNQKSKNSSIGFVPTMGALHSGHLSLVRESLKQNEITVVSIFVNPTQFDNAEDLEKYPNALENDLLLLEEVGCNVAFTPNANEMYGDSTVAEVFDFGGIENEMEGAFRKGHFNGVGTIVSKLFDIVKPTSAYFGEKDFQQLQIIKTLVEIKDYNINIVGCPILREENGLAMSSRNERLSENERLEASLIHNTLLKIKEVYNQNTIEELVTFVENTFKNNPHFELEYFSIADEKTLKTMSKKDNKKTPRAFIAVVVNSVRLIDNLSLS